MPKISIIIPVYNTELYLQNCLDSILRQTMQDFEIICVNDGSTDNSLQILNDYAKNDNRIKIIDKKNEGAAIARNTGLKNASGEYVYFLDSDDYIKDTFCEKMYNQIAGTSSDICICKKSHTYNDKKSEVVHEGSLKTELLQKEVFSRKDVKDIFLVTTRSVMNKLYKRSFIIENSLHFQNLSSCNDVFFECAALTMAKKITYVKESLFVSTRIRKGSISEKRGTKIENVILALSELRTFITEQNLLNELEEPLYNEAIRRFNFEIQFSNSILKKFEYYQKIKEFLPNKLWQKYLHSIIKQYTKNVLNWIFSIKNEYKNNKKYKRIKFFGISHKFEYNKNSQTIVTVERE